MNNRIRIGYIVPSMPIECAINAELIIKKEIAEIDFVRLEDLDSLLKLVINSPYNLDFVHISVKYFSDVTSNSANLVQSIRTLLRLQQRKTKIFANVGEDDDPNIVRNIIPYVDGISIRVGNTWSIRDAIEDVRKFISGDYTVPRLIQQKLSATPILKRVVVVSATGVGDTPAAGQALREMLASQGAEYFCISQLSLLYTLLNDENFRIDVVGIDLNQLYQLSGEQAFTKIQTVHTLINSLYFVEDGIYKPRTTSIVGGVTLDTDPKIIKEFLSIRGVTGIMPYGSEFTREEKYTAMKAYLGKEHHIPERIQEIIEPKRMKRGASIDLTTRESQIYNIIVERGVSNKHIARMLGVSEPTVKMHVGNIFKKYNVRSRTQLVAFKK